MRSLIEQQKIDEAERNDTHLKIQCQQCGGACIALGKPVARNVSVVMTHEDAMILSRYCETCNIAVCGLCAGVSPSKDLITSYPCPKCRRNTDRTAAHHLRKTQTRLLVIEGAETQTTSQQKSVQVKPKEILDDLSAKEVVKAIAFSLAGPLLLVLAASPSNMSKEDAKVFAWLIVLGLPGIAFTLFSISQLIPAMATHTSFWLKERDRGTGRKIVIIFLIGVLLLASSALSLTIGIEGLDNQMETHQISFWCFALAVVFFLPGINLSLGIIIGAVKSERLTVSASFVAISVTLVTLAAIIPLVKEKSHKIIITLPRVRTAVHANQISLSSSILVSIPSESELYLANDKITLPNITPSLRALSDKRPIQDQIIYVRCGESIQYGAVVSVLQAIRDAGFCRIGLIVETDDGYEDPAVLEVVINEVCAN